MDVYLVGGAVRDRLLGRPGGDRDWVVVGASPQQMIDSGYRPVGKDFPVYLHPQSSEEYALARTERKSGPGHRGFTWSADASVTLEDDLERRDLTINAMAMSTNGDIIDPFDGRRDLQDRVLRHVSEAFAEDPLRVFRVARFAAQLPDFSVAQRTLALLRSMVAEGQTIELSAERVWQETRKALSADAPARFFHVLGDCGAMRPWFVELIEREIRFPARLSRDDWLQFGWMCAGLDPRAASALCDRLRVPNRYRRLAMLTAEWSGVIADWRNMAAEELEKALHAAGAFREPVWLDALVAIESAAVDPASLDALQHAVADIRRDAAVETTRLRALDIEGAALGSALRRWRGNRLRQAQRPG